MNHADIGKQAVQLILPYVGASQFDTPFIILDEATSSVDPENEAELQQAIEKLTEERLLSLLLNG